MLGRLFGRQPPPPVPGPRGAGADPALPGDEGDEFTGPAMELDASVTASWFDWSIVPQPFGRGNAYKYAPREDKIVFLLEKLANAGFQNPGRQDNLQDKMMTYNPCPAVLQFIHSTTKDGLSYIVRIHPNITCDSSVDARVNRDENGRDREDLVNNKTATLFVTPRPRLMGDPTPPPASPAIRQQIFDAVVAAAREGDPGLPGGKRKRTTKRRGRKRSTRKKLRR